MALHRHSDNMPTRERPLSRIPLHLPLLALRSLGQRFFCDTIDSKYLMDEIDGEFGAGQSEQIAVDNDPAETVIDERPYPAKQ